MNKYILGFVTALVLIWFGIAMGGADIDRVCVLGKVSVPTTAIGKRGETVEIRKDDRIVARECSEFSRYMTLRDNKTFKTFRKWVIE